MYVLIHSSTCSIARLTSVILQMNVNLSTEQGGDFTKFQKVDVQSNVQLTPTFVLKENKRTYLGTTVKQ